MVCINKNKIDIPRFPQVGGKCIVDVTSYDPDVGTITLCGDICGNFRHGFTTFKC